MTFGDLGEASTGLTDVAALERALTQEKLAPEILQYDEALVSRIQRSLGEQEVAMEGLLEASQEAGQGSSAAGRMAVSSLYRMELDRVRYLLRGYLRARLRKLEEQVLLIMDDAELYSRLSAAELEHGRQAATQLLGHVKATVLDHLPEAFRHPLQLSEQSEEKDMLPKLPLDSHVFVRADTDTTTALPGSLGEEHVLHMEAGEIVTVSYRKVREQVLAGRLHLV